jgi:hypothetical protein
VAIPYIVGLAVAALGVRWLWLYTKNRAYNLALERRIRNRQDLHRL